MGYVQSSVNIKKIAINMKEYLIDIDIYNLLLDIS